MTYVGRGLRVLAVMCVLVTLLSVTMMTGVAQDATPGTDQTVTGQGTDTTQTSTDQSGDANQTGAGQGTDSNQSGTGQGTDPSQTGTDQGTDSTQTGTDQGTDSTQTGTGQGTDPTQTGAGQGTDASQPGTPASDNADPTTTTGGGTDLSTPGTPTDNGNNSSRAGTSNALGIASPDTQFLAADTGAPNSDPAATVNVTIAAYLCATADDAADPADSCTAASAGVVFNIVDLANAAKQQATTDSTGSATISAPSGDKLNVTVNTTTMPAGYTLNGSATRTVTAADGVSVTFTFVGTATTGGKIQIISLSCPTNGPSSTTWRIIEPHTMSMMAAARMTCGPNSGASFTFTGNGLPSSGQTVTTNSSGTWMGTLPPGTYSITEDATGESNSITVASIGVSVATVIDYVHQAEVGTLDVKNFECPGAADSTEINVSQPGQPNGTTPGAGCTPADGSFQLDSGNPFSVGSDGEISIPTVPEGSFTFLDAASGQTASVDIVVGETTSVVVIHYVAMGSVSVTNLACANPVPAGQDSSDPSYWQQNCTSPAANAGFSLLDSGGNTVASGTTGQDGTLDLGFVKPGTYTIGASGGGVCAIFANGADASNGFSVAGGATVTVTAFSCEYASADTGGDTGDGTGGTVTTPAQTASSQPATTGSATVTQLPNTGAGAPAGRGSTPLELPIAFLILGGAVIAMRRRQKRAA